MLKCWVYFYRSVLGVPFAVPQGKVEIRAARNEDRAVKAAKRKFARRFGVDDWKLRADRFDIVSPGLSAVMEHPKPNKLAQRSVRQQT